MELSFGMTKDQLKDRIIENVKVLFRKQLSAATGEQIYEALAYTIRDIVADKWILTHEQYTEQNVKVVYYLSMEFLMGRFFGNAVINLSMIKEVKEVLEELGIDYNALVEAERDPGLGNGGLGRLAACFLDSMATMGYPAYGCGIRYRYGIFEQKIENGYQVEYPDNWLVNGDIWGIKRAEYACEVKFGGTVRPVKQENGKYKFTQENFQAVVAIPYDYPVIGYNNNTINTLRLWDAEAKITFDLQAFNQGNFAKSVEEEQLAKMLTDVLYPADDHISGKELRLKQQYFFISATLQRVLSRHYGIQKELRSGYEGNLMDNLHEYVQFQLNDTHPSVAVPELMRLLLDEYEMEWNDAWEITKATCAYTNHTIMSEALEKWPIELFSRLLPRIYMIVEEINRRFCAHIITRYGEDPDKLRNMAIIADGQVRMAFLAIAGSHSVNGVAQIHSDLLKYQELTDFYDIFPEKFNNKTNGITQRRWLAHCNPGLSELITSNIGDKWITDLNELQRLLPLKEDTAFKEQFMKVKRENKIYLSNYIKSTMGIDIDPDSVFDIQIKRLHLYKRQLLNILHVLDIYDRIKRYPHEEIVSQTFIFSAKAAASYRIAKLVIKLINSVADLVNNDPTVDGRIKVIFIENYRVSLAEKLIPAADVSEQISTAGKEASGTGNMKFMLNGAVTIGTLDGANVEIHEEVGDENIFIFGLTAEEVIKMYRENSYSPWDLYNLNQRVRTVLTMLINGTLDPDHDLFREIYDSLLNGTDGARADEYFVLKDLEAYANAQTKLLEAYKDKERWTKMAITNVAKSGKFSSDRTIKQYADEIWKLPTVEIK